MAQLSIISHVNTPSIASIANAGPIIITINIRCQRPGLLRASQIDSKIAQTI
jgi:hypothetical protein